MSIVLTSAPTSPVTITMNTADGQETTSPNPVIFDSTNWNIKKNITISAVDDNLDEAAIHSGQITFSVVSGDLFYNNFVIAPQAVNITDNDTSAVVVTSKPPDTVTEGGSTDTVGIKLATKPYANVSITVSGDSQITTGALDPVTLTFTPANWNISQPIVVKAIDDPYAESPATNHGKLTFSVLSGDALYDAMIVPQLDFAIVDNETAGVIVTQNGPALTTNVTEGGVTDSFTVQLGSKPQGNVTVNVYEPPIPGNVTNTWISINGTTAKDSRVLTFTPANWNAPQTITVGRHRRQHP